MDWSLLTKLVNTSKLAGWVRAGVAAGCGLAVAKCPGLQDVLTPEAQTELGLAVATLVVGAWSHFAKKVAEGNAPKVADAAKKVAPLLLAFALAGGMTWLTSCTSAQLTAVQSATASYDAALQNFTAAADALNGSVAMTSQTVGPYCQALLSAGKNLTTLAAKNETVVTTLNSTASVLKTYCNAMPSDIQSAIVALTDAAVAAKKAAGG